MNQFSFLRDSSRELELLPHIIELSLNKISTIFLESFKVERSDCLRIYCVVDGKFEWFINHKLYVLYPGEIAIILPGQEFGGKNGFQDIGSLFSLFIDIEQISIKEGKLLGAWSNLSASDLLTISKLLAENSLPVLKVQEVPDILFDIRSEIMNQEVGFYTKVNHLIDSLLIAVARQTIRQKKSQKDYPRTFMDLEKTLRQNLAHHWTVEEMASLFGLGTTAFTEKVKNHTGFPPLNYLINIRISEAIKLLKQPDIHFTEIALKTGFYSSQHFSTTFKKLTGYSPRQFRNKSLSNPNQD